MHKESMDAAVAILERVYEDKTKRGRSRSHHRIRTTWRFQPPDHFHPGVHEGRNVLRLWTDEANLFGVIRQRLRDKVLRRAANLTARTSDPRWSSAGERTTSCCR